MRILIAFLLTFNSYAIIPNIEKKDSHQLLKQYLKIHKDFSKKMCRPGSEEKFWKLFKNFRGQGYYVPITSEDKVDFTTVGRFLPELSSKKQWIKKQITEVKKIKNLSSYKDNVSELNHLLEKIVKKKQQYFETTSEELKIKFLNESKYLMIEFRTKFKKLLNTLSFLKSYLFPVNHFELRQGYDKYKKSKDKEGRKKSNEIYFYRKIVQDGAQNPNNTGSDTFFRAATDTVFKELEKGHEIIPENLRIDLEWVLKRFKRQIDRGKRGQIRRLTEWLNRTDETLDFYRLLKMNKVRQGDTFLSGEEFVERLSKSRFALKDYVLKKQAEVFEYWKDRDEVMKAIFVLETILYNEVGGIDTKEGTERLDVAQVAINRLNDDFYSTIMPGEQIHPYITSEEDKTLKKYKWLNVMMKEGEFSFTYYFIHGSVRIFCPEMTRAGRLLRLENIKLSIKALKNSQKDFEAMRYFSRASMLGRIDMTQIWKEYEAIDERPGSLLTKQQKIKNLYKQGEYKYLYEFKAPSNKVFKVLEIRDRKYAYSVSNGLFYKYRSPHLFRYFKKRQAL